MKRRDQRPELQPAKRPGSATSRAAALYANALGHHEAARFAEAESLADEAVALDPGHPVYLHFLGVLSLQRGDARRAATLIEASLANGAYAPASYYFLANAYRGLERPDDAIVQYRRALAAQPDYVPALNNLGRVLHEQGRRAEAATSFARALSVAPDPRVLCNLGNLRQDEGRLPDALSCFRRAITAAPNLAEAHNGAGGVLMLLGRHAEAIASFESAVRLRPEVVEGITNLARAAHAAGQTARALESALAAVGMRETPETRAVFATIVLAAPLDAASAPLREALRRAMTQGWARPRDLAPACLRILAQSPIDTMDPLLHALLNATPVCDPDLERVLTAARAARLDRAVHAADDDLTFACALARQCFINEYVFDRADDEAARAAARRADVATAVASGQAIAALTLLAVAAYFPLAGIPGAEDLLARAWPEPVAALVAETVAAPLAEARLAEEIPVLTSIDDDVSRRVQEQYEENPYPRWVRAAPPEPRTTLDAYFAAAFPAAPYRAQGRGAGIDMLVAGCGTGQQAVEMAQRFAASGVLAIDLSRASLAYARRQSATLGLPHLRYAQADLLRIANTEEKYDLIAATGVLHHLADPYAGWRALLACLRPGGVMHIGLYSALARQDVVAARAMIAAHGYPPTPDGIRQCRAEMRRAAPDSPLGRLARSSDFFATSPCRDLLFHAQESHTSLPEIAAFLDSTGLAFLGFDVAAPVEALYRSRHPDDPAATRLAQWDALERERPTMFAGMYQFWVQAPA